MTDHLAQVRRDGDAYLSRHDRIFIVRQCFYIGRPVYRWAEEHTVIETADVAEVIAAMPSIEGPQAVIAIDLRAGVAADVSKDIALAVAGFIRNGGWTLTNDLRNFIEEWWPVGSIIPAAA